MKDESVLREAAALNIIKPSFDESLKREFYFKGNKISAKMNDLDFYKIIDQGESFAKNDMLEVELQINQKRDESGNTFVNKSYQVNKIVRHILLEPTTIQI